MYQHVYEIDENKFRFRKADNMLQTLLLLSGMVGILAVLGWMLAGEDGAWWSLILALSIGLFLPGITPSLVLRMSGAQWLHPRRYPDMYRLVTELSLRANLDEVPQLYRIPSATPNAMTVGTRRDASIAISDGLLKLLNRDELAAVFAHEISHIKNGDIRVISTADAFRRLTLAIASLVQLLLMLILPVLIMTGQSISWTALLILMAAPSLSALLQLALSRAREFNADLDASTLSRNPLALATALVKIEEYDRRLLRWLGLPFGKPNDLGWLRTHPKTQERVARIMELASQPSSRPMFQATKRNGYSIPGLHSPWPIY
ncbi:MAG: M48 family metalloprotease [Magnetococcales bacterium]|nr:M48 family metalloprotease [Magnetococcales bacterium]